MNPVTQRNMCYVHPSCNTLRIEDINTLYYYFPVIPVQLTVNTIRSADISNANFRVLTVDVEHTVI